MIGLVLGRNIFITHVAEGKRGETMEVTVRRGRRRKQLLDNLN